MRTLLEKNEPNLYQSTNNVMGLHEKTNPTLTPDS
jgi:hypothetical protein